MAKTKRLLPFKDQKIQAQIVLEVNPEHEIYGKLMALAGQDEEKLARYAQLLHYQAMLTQGMPIENPAEFAGLICGLM